MMPLWDLHRGDGPLIVNVPHAGTFAPLALGARLTTAAGAWPHTDWLV
jgi:N-formylglutamate amidohydrolase